MKSRVFIIAVWILMMVTPLWAAESCGNLPVFSSLDCKDQKAVKAALNELHACMKKRFTNDKTVHSAAWPMVEVPASGPIVGGDGEWAVGCLNDFPCKEKRLAFIKKIGELPYLTMISGSYIVDFNQDQVYHADELSKYSILRVSGLKPDEPWFKVAQ